MLPRKVAIKESRMIRRRGTMKKRKLLTKLAAGAMAVALCVTTLNTSLAAGVPDGAKDYNRSPAEIVLQDSTVPYPDGVYTYPASDPLFAATKFHVFAEDAAEIQTHCNGNIATKFLLQKSNSGSNTLYNTQLPEVSYIRKLDGKSVINFGPETQVVFGDETSVYNKDNAEIYVDTYESWTDTEPDAGKIEVQKQEDNTFRVFTEKGAADNQRFINFDKEFQKLSKLSYNLAKEPTTAGVTLKENVIDMSGVTGTAYITVTPSQLMDRAFILENTDFIHDQALVINVDLGTLQEYTLPFTQVLLKDAKDGISFGLGEDKGDYTGHGNVLWNFFGRDENGQVVNYSGKLTTCSEFKGTILAPDAEIQAANSNQDGNFVGRVVKLGGGETHRWDFGGKLKTYPDSYGSVQVLAKEEGTDKPVKGVEVYLYDKGDESGDPLARIETDENGKTVIIGDIPVGDEITAVVKQIPYGYTISEDKQKVEIKSADLYEMEFILQKDTTATNPPETGYIKVIVKDADTGEYIKDLTAVVTGNGGTNVSPAAKTDEFGTTHTEKLNISDTAANNKYTVSIPSVPEGYEVPDKQTVTLTTANPDVVIFEISKKVDETPKGSIQVKVFEKGTNNPINDAVVSINDTTGHVIKEVTVVTDKTGETEVVGNLPTNIQYTTELIDIPDGYKLDGDAVQDKLVVKANDTTVVTYYLVKEEGSLVVTVKEQGTNKPVGNVEITVTKGKDAVTGGDLKTDSTGSTDVVKQLTVGADYTATVDKLPEYYTLVSDESQTKNIPDEDTVSIDFIVKKTGILEVTITDAKDKDKVIPGAKVTITDKDGNVIAKDVVTDENGQVVVKDLDGGDYTVTTTYVPDGYSKPDPETDKVIPGETTKVPLVVDKPTPAETGKLVVIVKEKGTENYIDDVKVNVTQGTTDVADLVTGKTGTAGTTDVADELTIGEDYNVMIEIPEGYTYEGKNPQTATIKDKNLVKVVFELEKVVPVKTGQLNVIVKDVTDPSAVTMVDKVDVDITCNGETVKELTTGSEGKAGTTVTVKDLTIGNEYKATLDVNSLPDNFKVVSDNPQTKEITDEKLVTIIFEIKQTGDLEVIITDKNEPHDPIKDAKVTITDENGDVVAKDLVTDENGKVVVPDLEGGKYTVTTTDVPEGYSKPDPTPGTVVPGQTTKVPLEIGKETTTPITPTPDPVTGKVVVTVKDEDGNPIKGVESTITCEDAAVTGGTVTTGTNGESTPVTDLTIDKEYTATVDETTIPEYYVLVTANPQSKEVVDETTVYIDFVVKKTGTLEVIIKDKDTQKPIPGATVTITDENGKEIQTGVKTDENGKVVVPGLDGGDYTVTTDTVPDGYTAPDPVTDEVIPGETTEVPLEVSKPQTPVNPPAPAPEKGKLEVIITDKNTGDPIPGATVVIKNPDGTVKETVTTDENGKTPVVDDLTVGDTYIVETTKVPEGYTAPAPTTQNIPGTTLVKVPLQVGRDSGIESNVGSLYVIITDKNTGKPIPGATVEVSNSTGETIKTVVTDDTGAFTVTDLKPDTYKVTTTKVPEGYTAPDPQDAAVKSNARTDVHLYVAKGETTPPIDTVVQTGDESNVQAVSIIAIIACLGIVVVAFKRKREEI